MTDDSSREFSGSVNHSEPGQSAEEQIERRADFIIRELDEFCAMASNHETVDLIENEKIAVGMMQTRCQLILSFLAARSVPKFKVISNG